MGGEVESPPPDEATVVHHGQNWVLRTEEVFTFGRAQSCTLCLDPDDRGISRLAGSVEHDGGTWWVWNRSSARPLEVVDDLGIRTVLAPGRRLAVAGPLTVVAEGSARRHALDVTVSNPPAPLTVVPGDEEAEGASPAATAATVVVNDQDRLALVALFAGYLESFPRYDPRPRSYADAAAALGWPRTTLVKRIEYLRTRLTNAGVPNLLGDAALPHLAEWALTTRVLSRSDLVRLRKPAGSAPEV
jgi:hypothetical protein